MNLLSGLITDIESKLHMTDIVSVLSSVSSVMSIIEENYQKDQNLRNTSIDTICDLLQKLKTNG